MLDHNVPIRVRHFTYTDDIRMAPCETVIIELPDGPHIVNGCQVYVNHRTDGDGGYFYYAAADHNKIYNC